MRKEKIKQKKWEEILRKKPPKQKNLKIRKRKSTSGPINGSKEIKYENNNLRESNRKLLDEINKAFASSNQTIESWWIPKSQKAPTGKCNKKHSKRQHIRGQNGSN